MSTAAIRVTLLVMSVWCAAGASAQEGLMPIQYNHPDLVVDLGVGLWAWPLPMDFDGDGDLDLVVSCPDKPYNGTYLFECPGPILPVIPPTYEAPQTLVPFEPPVRIADGPTNVQVSYVDGEPVVMTPAKIYADFRRDLYSKPIKLPLPEKIDPQYKRTRANQWKLHDYDNDGDLDVIVGLGVWDDYGWDDAWDAEGNWKNGPLHGFVYLVKNITYDDGSPRIPFHPYGREDVIKHLVHSLASAKFATPVKLATTDGKPIDVYGMPSPNFADFDGDGDADLICGEFLDGFTWFENVGTPESPDYELGRRLGSVDPEDPHDETGRSPGEGGIRMDLQMITPVAIDWDGDGDMDLICGDEDGRVAFIERLSEVERLPRQTAEILGVERLRSPSFAEPVYIRQQAADVKFGALVTPFGVDWDGDGDEDIIAGNTAGYIGFIENLGGGETPKWAAPTLLETQTGMHGSEFSAIGNLPIRVQAGPKGSIQGPCEAKWGYTTLSVADWEGINRLNIITNDIRGAVNVHWVGNFAAPVEVAWNGPAAKPQWTWWTPEENELVTQWRTTPVAVDWNGDKLMDLVMLDHEGYLAFYERREDEPGALHLLPPKRLFKIAGPCEFDQRHKPVGDKKEDLLRLNANRAGGSGRRKLCIVDWDGDGRLDLLVNSVNVNWLRNVRTDDEGFTWFEDMGLMDDRILAGHTTSPTTVDWDKNGIPDLLVGAEDGRLYYKRNPRAAKTP